jgi:uncharacterized protein (UPF0371 family)
MIERMVGPDDPMTRYKSPTDMGINMAKEGIVDDEVCRAAAKQEIVRRFFRYTLDYVEGGTARDTLRRMDEIMAKANVRPEDRSVVAPAREAAEAMPLAEALEKKRWRNSTIPSTVRRSTWTSRSASWANSRFPSGCTAT